MRVFRAAACAAGILAAMTFDAAAQFPQRQVTVVVPFEAGGGSDMVARLVDRSWIEETGERFNFRYQPGASGAVGTDAVARSAADGYTVGIVNVPDLVVQPLSGAGTFSLNDFDYIGQVNVDPIVLMVPQSSPFGTLDEFVEAAREAPGTLTVAITGTLGAPHFVALQLMEDAGIEVTLVPTQGGANTLARVAGGHVSAGLIGLGLFSTQEGGRALATTGLERSAFAEDVPTFDEAGYPIDIATSRVYVAPKGVPEDALAYLRETLGSVAQGEGFVAASREQGQGPEWVDGAVLETELVELEALLSDLMDRYGLRPN